MDDTIIKIENITKEYRLGVIGSTTLNAELQSWWARKRGKEDPNLKLGQERLDGRETFLALDGISLKVKRGEALGIIGANGAGKSTLLKVLSRVTAPTRGDIWINGRISSMLEVGTGFHGELTGRENIYMNGAILGMSKREIDSKINSIIEFSECEKFIDTPVKRYSSGMYVKLAFAVAANLDSEILVMDEVLAVGDMKFQKKCLGKMGDVAENEGRSVLYVSHNMTTIQNLCSRCIVLDHGRIIYDGDVDNAINVYMEYSKSELQTKFYYEHFKRAIYDLGKRACFTEVELLGREQAIYSSSENMRIRIKWESHENLTNVKIGFSLKYMDSSNVGFSECNNKFTLLKNTKYDFIFTYDLSNLAAGTYFLYLQIFVQDDMGYVHGIDQAEKIYFEVLDDNKDLLVWQRQYWGNIRLNKMLLEESTGES